MAGKKPFYKSKYFQLSIGIAVSAGCLWYALRPLLNNEEQWNNMVQAFRTANYFTLIPIFLVLSVFYWLKAWRWRIMLSSSGDYRTTKDLLPPIMIGFAFNNILPAHLGEFVRCFVFSRKQKVPFMLSFSSVALERVFDVIAILLYLGIGLIFIEGIDPAVQVQAYIFAAAAAVCVAGALVYVIWTKPFVTLFERILKAVPLIPHSLTDKVCRMIEAAAVGLHSIKNWRLLSAIMIISLIKWAFNGSLIVLSLWSFGLSASLPLVLVLLGVIAFGVTVPSTPGYFGVIQALFMLVLGPFIADKGALFAASIYYHMSQWAPVTAIGLCYFATSGISLHDVTEEKEHDQDPDLQCQAVEETSATTINIQSAKAT